MRILIPAVLRVATDAFVLGLAGGRTALAHPIAMAFLLAEGVWSLAESALARAELGRGREERLRAMASSTDAATKAFVLAGKRWALAYLVYQAVILAVFAWSAGAADRTIGPIAIAGFALYAMGALVRGWAMAVMGDRFKSWAVTRDAEGLATSGPYALVRHPSYLGLLLMAIGLPLIFDRVWLIALALLPLVALIQRVKAEEILLLAAYDEAHGTYARATKARLVPGLW